MCLKTTMSKSEQDKLLKKAADPMVCWKTVEVNNGIMYPLHQYIHISYHTGVNEIVRRFQTFTPSCKQLGAHFFRHRKDAVLVAKYNRRRRVVRCMIYKDDIDIVGYTSMSVYGYKYVPAITIVAHEATFAKVAREV